LHLTIDRDRQGEGPYMGRAASTGRLGIVIAAEHYGVWIGRAGRQDRLG
jgi:hypothetical protein